MLYIYKRQVRLVSQWIVLQEFIQSFLEFHLAPSDLSQTQSFLLATVAAKLIVSNVTFSKNLNELII